MNTEGRTWKEIEIRDGEKTERRWILGDGSLPLLIEVTVGEHGDLLAGKIVGSYDEEELDTYPWSYRTWLPEWAVFDKPEHALLSRREQLQEDIAEQQRDLAAVEALLHARYDALEKIPKVDAIFMGSV